MTTGQKIPKPSRRESLEAYEIVNLRAGGMCEGCGARPASEVHHRKYRSRGGRDEVPNLIVLCGGEGGMYGGNHSGCHGVAHSGVKGANLGWAVSASSDPAEVWVTYRGRRCQLMPNGDVIDREQPF